MIKDFKLFDIRTFFEIFEKRKLKFKKSNFHYNLNTRKQNITVDKKLYNSIMKTYFSIYMNELYYYNQPKYFFLSGFLEKGKVKKFFNVQYDKIGDSMGVGIVWFLRPSLSYLTNIKFRKYNSTYSYLRKIELRFKLHFDVNKLKNMKEVLKQKGVTKQLYILR